MWVLPVRILGFLAIMWVFVSIPLGMAVGSVSAYSQVGSLIALSCVPAFAFAVFAVIYSAWPRKAKPRDTGGSDFTPNEDGPSPGHPPPGGGPAASSRFYFGTPSPREATQTPLKSEAAMPPPAAPHQTNTKPAFGKRRAGF